MQLNLAKMSKTIKDLEGKQTKWNKEMNRFLEDIEIIKTAKPSQSSSATFIPDSNPNHDNQNIRYFRGWKDVLSPHHPCSLKVDGVVLRSQEHVLLL